MTGRIEEIMAKVDAVATAPEYMPFWGWHEDHVANDGKPEYRPALQQLRSEFVELLKVIEAHGLIGGRALQLGLGHCRATHEVWRCVFKDVVTIDWKECIGNDNIGAGADTHSPEAFAVAFGSEPYDFLFIDAGHSYEDVRRDTLDYMRLVRLGGIIAWHDALPRKGYEEIEVWKYVRNIAHVTTIGTEVGTAWAVKL